MTKYRIKRAIFSTQHEAYLWPGQVVEFAEGPNTDTALLCQMGVIEPVSEPTQVVKNSEDKPKAGKEA